MITKFSIGERNRRTVIIGFAIVFYNLKIKYFFKHFSGFIQKNVRLIFKKIIQFELCTLF